MAMIARLACGMLVGVAAVCYLESAHAQRAATRTAGQTSDGYLLPNGWTLTPAGEQITLTDMPLNIVPLADGKHVLVASSGYNQHELCVVDLAEKKIKSREKARQS